MATDALRVLESIDATLKAMLALAQQRTANIAHSAAPAVQAAVQTAASVVASDRDLNGKYGNPEVRFNPRDWTGASYVGRHFSECDPTFLDLIAGAYDYFAQQAEEKDERTNKGKPVAEYKRADAARARGWAKRMRDGVIPTPQPAPADTAPWTDARPDGW